jgi:hypothetical protein
LTRNDDHASGISKAFLANFDRTNGGPIVFCGRIPARDAQCPLIDAVGVSGGAHAGL